jgi:hypothetical protein
MVERTGPGEVGYHGGVTTRTPEEQLRGLIDEYRPRCLWFLREDYYPATEPERERVLGWIARYGDLDAFRRVGEIREWLSRLSSDRSAGF